jgi:hypothetical protein
MPAFSRLSSALGFSFLGLLHAPLLAQEGTVEKSFIPNYSIGSLGYAVIGDSDFDDGDGSLSQDQYDAELLAPISLQDEWKLTAGVRYRLNTLDFGGRELPFANSLDLHRLEVPFNLWIDYSDRWNFWFRASPGLYSDFDSISSDAFTFSALALGSYQWTETLSVAVGGYYSRDLGSEKLLPAAGFIWKPDPHWSLALTVPRIELAYAPTRDWLLAARAYPSGGGWNISGVDGDENADLNLSSVRAGLGVERRLFGKVWGSVDGGLQFAQELELEGSGRSDFTEDLDDSWFVNFGIKLRF